jgi:hypothetical protein
MNSVLIRSKTEKDDQTQQPLYWSNKDGWVDKKSADRFRPFEKASLRLPIGGEWVKLR